MNSTFSLPMIVARNQHKKNYVKFRYCMCCVSVTVLTEDNVNFPRQ